MKRDWDIIRNVLIKLDEKEFNKYFLGLSDFPEEIKAEVSYNVELLMESGLVHGEMSHTLGSGVDDFHALRLTWEGHEFLDAIRSDGIWERTKKEFISKGISMTFDLVKTVAVSLGAELLKSQIGIS